MLRRHGPLCDKHLLASDSETESDNLSDYYNSREPKRNKKGKGIERDCHKGKKNKKENFGGESSRNVKALTEDPDSMVEQAKKYQEYMKQIPVPPTRGSGSDVVFITWEGLAKSMKELYGQPLHYLTHVLVKQWDQSRIGNEDEDTPMDNIINPFKAEATIWDVEEVHRRCTSHVHLASLWLCDPGYHAFVDEVIPPS